MGEVPEGERAMRSRRGLMELEIMIVVAIIVIIILIAVPGFIRKKNIAEMRACQKHLTMIDMAISQSLDGDSLVDLGDRTPEQLARDLPEPRGAAYEIDRDKVTCTYGGVGHRLADVKMTDQALFELQKS